MSDGVAGISGLATGLPTDEIIDALVETDRLPAVLMEARRDRSEARLEAVRTLNLRMLDADTELFSLKRSSTFGAKTTSVSDGAVFSATATSLATAGTYNITVNSIAEAQQQATAGQADKDTALFTGDLTIGVGDDSATLTFTGATSLTDIVQQINLASGTGVTASIVNDPTTDPANPYRVVLTARETGADNTISITSTLSGGSPDSDPFAAMTTVRAAADASVDLTVGSGANAFTASATSSDNSVSDLIEGVALNLTEAGSSTLTIANDTASARDAITGFVNSINDAISYFDTNASYDDAIGEAGILFSENGIRRSLDDVVRAMTSAAESEAGQFRTLAAIGITLNGDSGLFELNEVELDAALAEDIDGVRDLFVAGGLGDAIDDQVNDLTLAVDGDLATRQTQLESEITRFNNRIEELDELVAIRRARYEAEFLNLERLTAGYQSTQNFLAGQIDAFANLAASQAGRQ